MRFERNMVEVTRFELATSASRTHKQNAYKRLRYAKYKFSDTPI